MHRPVRGGEDPWRRWPLPVDRMAARPTLPAVDRLGSRLSTNSEGVPPDKLHYPTVRRSTRFRALSPSPLIAGASASSLILWVGGAAGSAVGAVGKHLLEWGSAVDGIP